MSFYPPGSLSVYDEENGTNFLPKMQWKKVIQNGNGQETMRSVQIRLPSAPAPSQTHEGGMEGDTPPVPDGAELEFHCRAYRTRQEASAPGTHEDPDGPCDGRARGLFWDGGGR